MTSFWVLLRVLFRGTEEFKIYYFNWYFVISAVVISDGIIPLGSLSSDDDVAEDDA